RPEPVLDRRGVVGRGRGQRRSRGGRKFRTWGPPVGGPSSGLLQRARPSEGDMRRFVLVLVTIVLAPALTSGQWLKYPADGLPRNKDGTLNRAAPAPRLADGHPDLSGLWHAGDPNRCRGRGGPFINCG